jgi:hypothetical protein
MRNRHLILATLTYAMISPILSAQEQAEAPLETFLATSENPAQNPVPTTKSAAKSQARPVLTRGPYFYSSARRHHRDQLGGICDYTGNHERPPAALL